MTIYAVSALWTLLACYGIVIQSFNLRWALITRQVIRALGNPSEAQTVAIQAHVRINIMRAIVVLGNLLIGVTALLTPSGSGLGVRSLATPTAIIFSGVFILNEIAWNTIVTLEVRSRARLRKLT